MDITQGKYNSMPSSWDLLETGISTGLYSGFLVVEDVTITAMTTWNGEEKTDSITLTAGTTFQCGFKSITISGGSIIAYKG